MLTYIKQPMQIAIKRNNMKTKDILITFFAITILGSIAYLWMAPSGAQQAPDITLQLIDGKKLEWHEGDGCRLSFFMRLGLYDFLLEYKKAYIYFAKVEEKFE